MNKFIKQLLNIFICTCTLIVINVNFVLAESSNTKAIKAGTFLKVLNLNEISTLMADAEDKVIFRNLQDMYLYETNAIPENTMIYGEVEEVLEPVAGKDGAIKISIYKFVTPDKKVYKVKGHIYGADNNYIGGAKTSATYYKKVPHYVQGFRPILQAAPLNILEMGKHTVILPGAELFMIIEEDLPIK